MDNDTRFAAGKRMPYRVPEGYFDALKAKVRDEALASADVQMPEERAQRMSPLVRYWLAGLGAAAAAALWLMPRAHVAEVYPHDAGMEGVLSAYDAISASDRNTLQEAYEDDIFLYLTN